MEKVERDKHVSTVEIARELGIDKTVLNHLHKAGYKKKLDVWVPHVLESGWEVLMHPPYSPDIAPSDYHLFRSLQNFLNGVKLTSKEACENHLKQFFDQKPQKFYRDGIMALPQKWQNIIENNGAYLV
ncbi:SETMR methyltransferase, partial [Acromyrmex charruanus]